MPELQNQAQHASMLVYENDELTIALLSKAASNLNITLSVARNFTEFNELYNNQFSIVFIDLMMPKRDGIEVLRLLRELDHKTGVIISSGEQNSILKAAASIAKSYELRLMGELQKPFSNDSISEILKKDIPKALKKRTQRNSQFTRNDVRRCIAKDEILVMFQPKIDIESLQFVSAEALVRWQHPDLGILGPGAFLPLVEELDMIGTMTTLIMEKAYSQVAKWESIGIKPNIAINLSARSFNDLNLPEQMVSITNKHNIPPNRVTLEVTESWRTQDTALALDILTRLRLKGFKLSIDDFGTGYSSMTQLKQVPFTELKLDQSFVRGAGSDQHCSTFYLACITQ